MKGEASIRGKDASGVEVFWGAAPRNTFFACYNSEGMGSVSASLTPAALRRLIRVLQKREREIGKKGKKR